MGFLVNSLRCPSVRFDLLDSNDFYVMKSL
jgi:hypothetical protein